MKEKSFISIIVISLFEKITHRKNFSVAKKYVISMKQVLEMKTRKLKSKKRHELRKRKKISFKTDGQNMTEKLFCI